MRKKEQELLSCLVQESADFVTSRDLSKRLSLSEKTIRTLIKQLNDSWQDAFCIQGVTGKGYYLDVKDKDIVAGLVSIFNLFVAFLIWTPFVIAANKVKAD